MSNPSIDEMDALMGAPGARNSHDDEVIEDVGADVLSANREKAERKAGAVRLIAGVAIALVVVAGGAFYISSLRGAATATAPAPPDVLAQALGQDYADPALPSEQPTIPPAGSASPGGDYPSGELAYGEGMSYQPVSTAGGDPRGLEQGAEQGLELPSQAGATGGATVNIPLDDFTALNSRVEELAAQLEAAEKERDEAKATPRTVTRNVPVQTSFVLVDTLVDGAVLRDQAGNELIVPLRARVRTNGDRLNVEG